MHIVIVAPGSDLMPAVLALRHQVFVEEQRVPPELERDEFDDFAIHLAALRSNDADGGRVIGTLRIVLSGPTAKLGRMAVLASERKSGVGSRLMERADEVAGIVGVREIVLHAQLAAKEFYARLGYRPEGEIFEEAGIAHVTMRKRIA